VHNCRDMWYSHSSTFFFCYSFSNFDVIKMLMKLGKLTLGKFTSDLLDD
jgi:hypothetical protein